MNANNISSGILSIERGGTGQNTLNNLKGRIDESTGKEITKHRIIIDVSEENDYINNGTNYEIKFLKSKIMVKVEVGQRWSNTTRNQIIEILRKKNI